MKLSASCVRLPVIITVFAALIVSMALVAGCKGDRRLLSKDQQIQLGRDAGNDYEREIGRDYDSRRNALVQRLGARIADAATPPDFPYEFRVLADDRVNAVAFPGGRIYFFRGIIETLDYNEDQLAWIAGHEATHVAREHAARRIERQLGYQLALKLIFGDDTAGEIAGAVAGLMLQDYGRDNELEADRFGARYAYEAGYDPTAALAVMDEFRRIQGKDPSDFEILFMSHPGSTERSDQLQSYLRQQGWSGQYFQP
ncbi:MAG: M48 family metalloprotease [Armatimonadota bacterium]